MASLVISILARRFALNLAPNAECALPDGTEDNATTNAQTKYTIRRRDCMKPMRHRQNLLQAEELKGPGGRLPVTVFDCSTLALATAPTAEHKYRKPSLER
jgi:hypothetical protein